MEKYAMFMVLLALQLLVVTSRSNPYYYNTLKQQSGNVNAGQGSVNSGQGGVSGGGSPRVSQDGGWNYKCMYGRSPDGNWVYNWVEGSGPGGSVFGYASGQSSDSGASGFGGVVSSNSGGVVDWSGGPSVGGNGVATSPSPQPGPSYDSSKNHK